MKLYRPAAVLASAVILAAGAVVTVNAVTTTHPIKLCSNNKNGAVSVPGSSGSCARGTTEFYVADDSDMQALAGRVDAAEEALSSQMTVRQELHFGGNSLSGVATAAAICPPGFVATGGGFRLQSDFTIQHAQVVASYGSVPRDEEGRTVYYPAPNGEPAVAWAVAVQFTSNDRGMISATAHCSAAPAE